MSKRREEYRKPQDRTLADLMVGHRVLLQHLAGPGLNPAKPDELVRGWPEAVTGAYWLHAVSQQGIEISRELSGDAADIYLVPWGSVLMLNGLVRGELEQEAQNTFAIDRQELLERLNDPQAEDRSVGLDARRYLSFNPNDEEVRGALGRLPSKYQFP